MPPNIAMPTITLAAIVTAAGRIRKIRSGISAASPIARSASTNATRPSAPMTYAATDCGESQPHCRPCSATVSSGTRQTTRAIAPHQSMRTCRGVWWMCRVR